MTQRVENLDQLLPEDLDVLLLASTDDVDTILTDLCGTGLDEQTEPEPRGISFPDLVARVGRYHDEPSLTLPVKVAQLLRQLKNHDIVTARPGSPPRYFLTENGADLYQTISILLDRVSVNHPNASRSELIGFLNESLSKGRTTPFT